MRTRVTALDSPSSSDDADDVSNASAAPPPVKRRRRMRTSIPDTEDIVAHTLVEVNLVKQPKNIVSFLSSIHSLRSVRQCKNWVGASKLAPQQVGPTWIDAPDCTRFRAYRLAADQTDGQYVAAGGEKGFVKFYHVLNSDVRLRPPLFIHALSLTHQSFTASRSGCRR